MSSSAPPLKSNSNHISPQHQRNSYTTTIDQDVNIEEDLATHPGLKPTSTRKWSSLEDHAEHVRGISIHEEYTPRPADRREGFMWDSLKTNETRTMQMSRLLPASEPRSKEYITTPTVPGTLSSRADGEPPTLRSMYTWSTNSGSGEDVSRKDTIRSSTSSIARGIIRTGPDMRMFVDESNYTHKDWQIPHHRDDPREQTRLGYIPSSKSTSVPQETNVDKWSTGNAHHKDRHITELPASSHPRSGLKDRRNLEQSAALKLTLPMLLPRQRLQPTSDFIAMQGLAPPRSRSPKTPWPQESSPMLKSFYGAPATSTAIPDLSSSALLQDLLLHDDILQSSQSQPQVRRVRDRCYITRPRYSRNRSGTSDGSLAKTPDDATSTSEHLVPEDLRQLSKRARQKRWGGPWSSNTEPATPEPPFNESSRNHFSLVRFLSPRRHKHSSFTIAPRQVPPSDSTGHTRTIRSQQAYSDVVTNIMTPPTFAPPGLRRIPTPPHSDQYGEVKGQLAGFIFSLQDKQQPKRSPNVPRGGWDSDALLMSQKSGITPSSGSSNESPQGQLSHLPTPTEFARLSSSGYVTGPSNVMNEPSFGKRSWFRVPVDAEDSTRQCDDVLSADDRAKLEWLIPEHLPASPLCPLHIKYQGPSKGFCVFHGRQKRVGEGRTEDRNGTNATEQKDYLAIGKRRRLVSLSSP